MDFRQWALSLDAFSKWLARVDAEAQERWLRAINGKSRAAAEGAVAEAAVWDYLACVCDSVRLAESPGTGGVDFEFVANGHTFVVEVTNISTDAATRVTGMEDQDQFQGYYGLLTSRIRRKIRGKFRQARREVDHPVLVAVTTLHRNASISCVNRTAIEFAMGSPPRITGDLDPVTGEVEGDLYQSTNLKESIFLSPHPVLGPDGVPIANARFEPIAGFLVGGFGVEAKAVSVLGGLNPSALRPFDPSILPHVPFCEFAKWPVTDSMAFRWTISERAEREASRGAAERRLRAAGHGDFLDRTRHEIARRPS